jgi:molybdopterin-guanine dinucleotide biosynthesis protein B
MLTERLIAELTGRGYRVCAIKHAHENFDIDQPGRDSYRLREAGARRVLLSSPKRWALMHELGGDPEVPLDQLLGEAAGFDLVLVEGYKREPFPKIEIRRDGGASRQPLAGSAPQIVAIASDRPSEEVDDLPVFHLDDIGGMVDFIAAHLRLGAA